MITQQNETLHYIHGLPGHRKHFGHEVAVTFEESDGTQLDVEQQSRHSGKGLQVLLPFIGRGSDQRLQTLRFNGHLSREMMVIQFFLEVLSAIHPSLYHL